MFSAVPMASLPSATFSPTGRQEAQGFPQLPGVRLGEAGLTTQRVLSMGSADLNAVLPDGGLPRGAVSELAVVGGAALGTSLALRACSATMDETRRHGGEPSWCAFVDPSRTLYGPGVDRAGVALERLLVVRPPAEAMERTAIRLVEAHAFSVVAVDTVGALDSTVRISLASWNRAVRRLSLAAEESGTVVILITDGELHRPLPLPVALRLELSRPGEDRLSVRVAKDRRGRVSGPHRVAWGPPRRKVLGGPWLGEPIFQGIRGARVEPREDSSRLGSGASPR